MTQEPLCSGLPHRIRQVQYAIVHNEMYGRYPANMSPAIAEVRTGVIRKDCTKFVYIYVCFRPFLRPHTCGKPASVTLPIGTVNLKPEYQHLSTSPSTTISTELEPNSQTNTLVTCQLVNMSVLILLVFLSQPVLADYNVKTTHPKTVFHRDYGGPPHATNGLKCLYRHESESTDVSAVGLYRNPVHVQEK